MHSGTTIPYQISSIDTNNTFSNSPDTILNDPPWWTCTYKKICYIVHYTWTTKVFNVMRCSFRGVVQCNRFHCTHMSTSLIPFLFPIPYFQLSRQPSQQTLPTQTVNCLINTLSHPEWASQYMSPSCWCLMTFCRLGREEPSSASLSFSDFPESHITKPERQLQYGCTCENEWTCWPGFCFLLMRTYFGD